MRRTAFILLAASLLLPAAAGAAERFERDLEATSVRTLRLAVDRGAVEVVARQATAGPARLRVEASARGLGASEVAFALERRGEEVILRATEADWLGFLASPPRIRVQVSVPRHVDVLLETERGPVPLKADAGAVRVRAEARPAVAREAAAGGAPGRHRWPRSGVSFAPSRVRPAGGGSKPSHPLGGLR